MLRCAAQCLGFLRGRSTGSGTGLSPGQPRAEVHWRQGRVLRCNRNHCVVELSLSCRDPPASVSRVLWWRACSTALAHGSFLLPGTSSCSRPLLALPPGLGSAPCPGSFGSAQRCVQGRSEMYAERGPGLFRGQFLSVICLSFLCGCLLSPSSITSLSLIYHLSITHLSICPSVYHLSTDLSPTCLFASPYLFLFLIGGG